MIFLTLTASSAASWQEAEAATEAAPEAEAEVVAAALEVARIVALVTRLAAAGRGARLLSHSKCYSARWA